MTCAIHIFLFKRNRFEDNIGGLMSISRKTIGVVLCTYNGEKFLSQQLESIMCQTRPPARILILDDGSSDRTCSIAHSFAENDSRIHLIQNETNLGFIHNFEKGMSLCETDLIALCDQDDVWFPNKLERLAAELEAHPGSGMAYCNAELITADGTPTGHIFFNGQNRFSEDQSYARSVLLERRFSIPGNFILLESELKDIVLPLQYTRTHAHDALICLNAFFLFKPRYIPEPLTFYRLHSNQASGAFGGAYAFFLKGTQSEFKKKKWYDLKRLSRNLKRAILSPFKHSEKIRERRERAYNGASDMLVIIEQLMNQRRQLKLPELSSQEHHFIQKMKSEWLALLSSKI